MSDILKSTFDTINPATGFLYNTISTIPLYTEIKLGANFTSEEVESSCHGLVGKRAPHDTTSLKRYAFIIPGRVVYAKCASDIKETFAQAVLRSDTEGSGIIIGPDFKVEYLNDKSFRMSNAIAISSDVEAKEREIKEKEEAEKAAAEKAAAEKLAAEKAAAEKAAAEKAAAEKAAAEKAAAEKAAAEKAALEAALAVKTAARIEGHDVLMEDHNISAEPHGEIDDSKSSPSKKLPKKGGDISILPPIMSVPIDIIGSAVSAIGSMGSTGKSVESKEEVPYHPIVISTPEPIETSTPPPPPPSVPDPATQPAAEPPTTSTSANISPLNPQEEAGSLIFEFATADDAKKWEAALLVERDRVHFSHINLLDGSDDFRKELQSLFLRSLCASTSKTSPFRNFYYRCLYKDGPCIILEHLSEVYFSLARPETWRQNIAIFATLVEAVVTNRTLRLILLGFTFEGDLIGQFEKHLKSTYSPAAAAKSWDAYDQKYPNSTTNGKLILSLANYIIRKSNNAAWNQNRDLLPKLFGCEINNDICSPEVGEWIRSKINSTGQNATRISWAQLKLLLEPTPYCGFYFIDHYVNNGDARSARELIGTLPYTLSHAFKAVYTNSEDEVEAAHFVGYLEWDSLQRGYEEFELKNSSNSVILGLLKRARDIYSTPLVTSSHLPLKDMTGEEVQANCVTQLLDGAKTETKSELAILREICAYWMTHTKETHGVSKAPRKAQIISFLSIISWAEQLKDVKKDSLAKMMIGLIAEGEDKALINAMLAIYFVKGMGKHVHVMYYDAVAMDRDYARMKPFFTFFNLTSSENVFATAADITFCMQREMCQYYRDSVFFGHSPLSNTICLVDEIDDMNIGKNPNSIYGKRDEDLNAPFKEYFDLFLATGAETQPPKSNKNFSEVAWLKASLAFKQFSVMEEGKPNGYALHNGKYELLDSSGRVAAGRYHFGLEMVRYKLAKEPPSINSKFYFQSVPYIFSRYYAIFGMAAGSRDAKLSEARADHRAFLDQHFGAVSFHIPNDEFQTLFTVVELKKEDAGDSATSAANATATATNDSPNLTALRKGLLMNELCDKAYHKYPHSEGKWPSHSMHREIINFIDDESRHTIDGINAFAAFLKISVDQK